MPPFDLAPLIGGPVSGGAYGGSIFGADQGPGVGPFWAPITIRRINDSLGHQAGDALLIQAAGRLIRCLRTLDTVARARKDAAARLGGDEFSILLEGLRRPSDAIRVADRIKQHLLPPFSLNDEEVVMSLSVGITTSNGEHKSAQELLREANTAMYRAKRSGKDRLAVFNQEMQAEAMARLRLENDLRRAIKNNEFELWYQPIVTLELGQLTGFEALIRWLHPERGLVLPDEFISVAEENGLIVPIGTWVMKEACSQLHEWNTHVSRDRDLSISVNVSKRQMAEPGFVDDVRRIIDESGVDGNALGLEITESVIIGDPESTIDVLTRLRELGIRLHMDDFGKGLSSLSCLHEFPIDVLKIDRSFASTVTAKRAYAAVIHSVATLAHNLGMKVIAEGIETPEQLALMIALDCDFGQGYHFSKPVDRTLATGLITKARFCPQS